MTKDRDPVTIEDTLRVVVGQLKLSLAAELLGHHPGYVSALTDPDRREQLNVRDLELLDLAHHAAFGTGFPLFEALGRRLATAGAERFADAVAIGRHGATLALEGGQAVSACLEASLAPGDEAKAREALRQTEDVARAAGAAMSSLRAILDRPEAPDTS